MQVQLSVEEEGSGRVEEVQVDAAAGDTVRSVLESAGINPQTVLVERDGQIITQQDELSEDDTDLRVLDVISGG